MFAGDDKLRIGTSSWSSRDWVGPFYPQGMKPVEFIAHYASVYDTVEIDATFYRMPTTANIEAWVRRTPPEFVFAVKTPRVITHEKILLDVDDDVSHFWRRSPGLEAGWDPSSCSFPISIERPWRAHARFWIAWIAFLTKCRRDFVSPWKSAIKTGSDPI